VRRSKQVTKLRNYEWTGHVASIYEVDTHEVKNNPYVEVHRDGIERERSPSHQVTEGETDIGMNSDFANDSPAGNANKKRKDSPEEHDELSQVFGKTDITEWYSRCV